MAEEEPFQPQCTTCGVNLTVKHVKDYDLSLYKYIWYISRVVSDRKLVLIDTLWCRKHYEWTKE